MALINIILIAKKEIKDARRNRWFILLSIIFSGLVLAFSLFGYAGLGNLGVSGFGRTTASILNLVLLIVPLMGLLLGAMSLSAEREQGTLQTLMAQPVVPGEIIIGKYLGIASALLGAILFGFGLSAVVIAFYGGTSEIAGYLVLSAFTLLLALVSLSLGFLLSVFNTKSTTATGAAIFLWFALLFLSDLGMMGAVMTLQASPRALLWMAMANPVQVFRMSVMSALAGDLELLGGAGTYALELFGNHISYALGGLLILWMIAPFVLSVLFFKKRCFA